MKQTQHHRDRRQRDVGKPPRYSVVSIVESDAQRARGANKHIAQEDPTERSQVAVAYLHAVHVEEERNEGSGPLVP